MRCRNAVNLTIMSEALVGSRVGASRGKSGVHGFSSSGDIMHLICHETSQDHLIEGSFKNLNLLTGAPCGMSPH